MLFLKSRKFGAFLPMATNFPTAIGNLCFFLDVLENRKTYEKARLRFAHAETVVPFTCLLGLFLEGSGEFSL